MNSIAATSWWLAAMIALAPTRARGEFQVNTYTTGAQFTADVAASPAGFVATWNSFLQDGSGFGVFGQRYDSTGAPLGGEFQVHTQTSGDDADPAVAMDATGAFVVVWTAAYSILDHDVIGRRYDGAGVPLGGEFVVNTYTTSIQEDAQVAMDSGGNFVVVWSAETSADAGRGIRGQRYDSNGMALGGEFQVNTYTTGQQAGGMAATLAGGGFVVVWYSTEQEGPSNSGIFGQRYDAGGVPAGGEFHVNTATLGTQENPAVAAEAGGGFVVAWHGRNGADYSDILAQRYDAAGLPVGGEFVVNTYTDGGERAPSVASDGGAGFVIVWETIQYDFQEDVRGQRYDAAGQPLGSEFQVNTQTVGSQLGASAAGDGAGSFVVVWTTSGNSFDIAGQVNKPDRLIRGRRLQVRERLGTEEGRSVLIFGTESPTEIGPTIDGDPTVDGATLRVIANGTTDSDQTFVLDAAGWQPATPTGFRYSGPTGGDGDPVKKVFLKRASSGRALVKVVLRGTIGTQTLDVVPPDTGTDGGLVLDIGGGGGRYCVTLGGAAGGTEVQDTATGWRVLSATAEPGCLSASP